MCKEFTFETFADARGSDFRDYLSMVISKLPKTDDEYRAIQERINAIYDKYPRVMGVFDRENASELTKEECEAVIEIAGLRNQRTEIEIDAVYFRGCYDSVGYMKKAGLL